MDYLLILKKDGTYDFDNYKITKETNKYLMDLYNNYGDDSFVIWKIIVEKLAKYNNKLPFNQTNEKNIFFKDLGLFPTSVLFLNTF